MNESIVSRSVRHPEHTEGAALSDRLILEPEKKNPHILDYFTLLARRRTLILSFMLFGGVAFAVGSFFMRQTFNASVTILPPEKAGMSNMLSFLTGTGGGAMDLLKSSENPAMELYRDVLYSRSLAEEASKDPRVRNFMLKFDTSERGIEENVHNAITTEPVRSGTLFTVTVIIETTPHPSAAEVDSSKAFAGYFGNFVVNMLDHYNRERLMTTAHETRVFIEKGYQVRMAQLDSLYRALQTFQEDHKTVALPEQLSATVTAAAQLGAQVQQLQMQIAVEEHDLNPNSNHIMLLKTELEEAQRSLDRYDNGTAGEYAVALNNVPSLSRQLAQLTREVKLTEQINAYLRQQLEQERIAEVRDVRTFQVLDPAAPPLKKASPKRSIMGIIGALLGLLFAMMYIAYSNYMARVKANPLEHRRVYNFFYALRRGRKGQFVPVPSGAPFDPRLPPDAITDFGDVIAIEPHTEPHTGEGKRR